MVFPTGMSAAGDVPGRGARAIGVVSTIGYTGFILGSPTIGLVADRVGLDQALLLVAAVSATDRGAGRVRARAGGQPGAPAGAVSGSAARHTELGAGVDPAVLPLVQPALGQGDRLGAALASPWRTELSGGIGLVGVEVREQRVEDGQ